MSLSKNGTTTYQDAHANSTLVILDSSFSPIPMCSLQVLLSLLPLDTPQLVTSPHAHLHYHRSDSHMVPS